MERIQVVGKGRKERANRHEVVEVNVVCNIARMNVVHVHLNALMQFVVFFTMFSSLSSGCANLLSMTDSRVSEPRLLSVITYGYEFGVKEGKRRKHFLDIILRSFVTLCEADFSVSVAVAAYETEANSHWQDHVNTSMYFCTRNRAHLPISMELFPFRELGKGAFGTRGDLAIRHREIFLREKSNFDYFLVQEDDVKYSLQHVQYFISTSAELSNTNYYPTFTDYEVSRGVEVIDWRLRNGSILLINERPFFTWHYPMPPIGRGYMITSDMLKRIEDTDVWVDPSKIRGEFNPLVATSSWISEYFQMRLVFPVERWHESLVHHMPNKYIRQKVTDVKYLDTTRNQSTAIFRSCTNSSSVPSARDEVHFSGIGCHACLQAGNEVELRTHVGKYINNTVPFDVVAHFSCERKKHWDLVVLSIFVYQRERELLLLTLTCVLLVAFLWRCRYFFVMANY